MIWRETLSVNEKMGEEELEMSNRLQQKALGEAHRNLLAAYEAASNMMQWLRNRQSDPLDAELEDHWKEVHERWEEGMDWIDAVRGTNVVNTRG